MRVQDVIDYIRFKRKFDLLGVFAFLKLLFYKLQGKKLILINSAAGLGDYLWIRNYFELIKNSKEYRNSAIILLATERWMSFAKELDKQNIDLFINFHNPHRPLFTESFLLRAFKFDIFLTFFPKMHCYQGINSFVTADKHIDAETFLEESFANKFYESRHNLIVSQLVDVPNDFKHTLPIVTEGRKPNGSYAVLVPEGFAMGELSVEQLSLIVDKLDSDYEMSVILLGLKRHEKMFSKLKKIVKNNQRLLNGCGKYKEIDLLEIIDGASLVITPNTSIYHMALQLNKKTICLTKNAPMALDFEAKDIKYIVTEGELKEISPEEILDTMEKI